MTSVGMLEPRYQIEMQHEGGATLLRCGDDAQLDVFVGGKRGEIARAGVYELRFEAVAVEGHIMNPCVYMDFGGGFYEGPGSKVLFVRDRPGVWTLSLVLRTPAYAIRFDPSEAPCAILMSKFAMARASLPYRAFRLSTRIGAEVLSRAHKALPPKLKSTLVSSGVSDRVRNFLVSRGRHALVRGAGEIPDQRPPILTDTPTNWWGGLVSDYYARMFLATGGRDTAYAAIAAAPVDRDRQSVKTIAYYLPQFYPFPENDAWWGKGFTEWTNVTKAVAQFDGHYQPKLAGELGYYDLRVPETIARQIELAKLYGLHAFCFYYYWFDGKRLLDKPLDLFLESKTEAFDFNFCLCWANENWTRRWDGAEQEVLMAQRHSEEDSERVFDDIYRYISDSRYVTVEGKPVILIYRPDIIPDIDKMLAIWRDKSVEMGLPGLFIVSTNSFGFDDPQKFGFDALCEFPPHGLKVNGTLNQSLRWVNSAYTGYVFEYAEAMKSAISAYKDRAKSEVAAFFPGAMTAWDNEARRTTRGNVFHNSTPTLFHTWLSEAAKVTAEHNPPDRRFVFINAWNEWAEGAYLEPDRRFGYAYLAAVADVVREAGSFRDELKSFAEEYNATQVKTADTAICAHLFYQNLINTFAVSFHEFKERRPCDILLSIPDTWTLADLERAAVSLKPTRIIISENRGRDVWPFIQTAQVGHEMGYRYGCKLHSKRSPQRADGDAWRDRLFAGLLSPEAQLALEESFFSSEGAGLAAPGREFVQATEEYVLRDNLPGIAELSALMGNPNLVIDEFVAGTMFWFAFAAVQPIIQNVTRDTFGPELGQIDATPAHAFERVIVAMIKVRGGKILKYEVNTQSHQASGK